MILAIPLFGIGNVLTPPPDDESGNGNPAMLLLPILACMFVYLVYLTVTICNKFSMKPAVFIIGMTVTFLHLVISFLYQRSSFLKYKTLLAETYKKDVGHIDWGYIETITSFMSLHVNSQYFNTNTYFMFLSSSLCLSLLIVYYNQVKSH